MTVRRASALSQPPSQPSLPPFGPSPTPPPPGSPLPRTVSVTCTVCAQRAAIWRRRQSGCSRGGQHGRAAELQACRRGRESQVKSRSRQCIPKCRKKITGFWPFSPHSRENHRANKSTSISQITTYVSLISTASEPTTRLHRHCTAHTD